MNWSENARALHRTMQRMFKSSFKPASEAPAQRKARAGTHTSIDRAPALVGLALPDDPAGEGAAMTAR